MSWGHDRAATSAARGWRPHGLRHHARLNDLLRRSGGFLTIVGSLSGRGTRSGRRLWSRSHCNCNATISPCAAKSRSSKIFRVGLVKLVIHPPNDVVSNVTCRCPGYAVLTRDICEAHPEAATNIVTEAVIRAAPDGYTLLLAAPANAVNVASRPTALLFDERAARSQNISTRFASASHWETKIF